MKKIVFDGVDFDVFKFGSMKDWHLNLRKQGVCSAILDSEDKIKELNFLKKTGLPYQHFEIFYGDLSEENIDGFIRKNGAPFWINACPKNPLADSRRFFKPNLRNFKQASSFVSSLKINRDDYMFIVMQYPEETHFCGTAIFNGSDGVFEFINSRDHDFLARGHHTPDPALVQHGDFQKYSGDVHVSFQKALLKMLAGKKGYFEFVKGIINKKEGFFFFAFKEDCTHMNYFRKK